MDATTRQVVAQSVYSTKGLKRLSRQKEMYCFHLASGASPALAAKSVGATVEQAAEWASDRNIKAVLKAIREQQDSGLRMTRDKLSDLLLQSYYKAGTTTEEVAALREIGKLQGLYAPETVEITANVTNSKQLEMLSAEELSRLANMDDPTVIEGDFQEVSDD